MLKFYYNGIKGTDGKLQKCSYSMGGYVSLPRETITIYAKNHERFSAEIAHHFHVINETDSQVDYFENDRIRVLPSHPLYQQVLAALNKQTDRREANYQKKYGKAA